MRWGHGGRYGIMGCGAVRIWGRLCDVHPPIPSPPPPEVYAVVDLYGQCVQVSLTGGSGPTDNSLGPGPPCDKGGGTPTPGKRMVPTPLPPHVPP